MQPNLDSPKIALVTGASRGIGAAIVAKLIDEGYIVHGLARGQSEAEGIGKTGHPNFTLHSVDIADKVSLQQFLATLDVSHFDVIVNNAGLIKFEPPESIDLDIWYETLATNLTPTLLIINGLMHKINNQGSIINISSTDGFIGSYSSLAYSASKAAINNLTKSLCLKLANKQIRVNSIAPGWIDTGEAMLLPASQEAASLTPLARLGKPDEVAELVSFLVSPKASFINGTTIVIDGGYTCVDYIMKKESESINN